MNSWWIWSCIRNPGRPGRIDPQTPASPMLLNEGFARTEYHARTTELPKAKGMAA
jgi:hypothetical protein